MKCAFKWARKRQAGWYRRSLSKLLSLHLQRQELFLSLLQKENQQKRSKTPWKTGTSPTRSISTKPICRRPGYNLRADMKNKPAPLLNPGTGYFDMTAYQAFNDGKMTDYIPSDAELAQSIATLPKVPGME